MKEEVKWSMKEEIPFTKKESVNAVAIAMVSIVYYWFTVSEPGSGWGMSSFYFLISCVPLLFLVHFVSRKVAGSDFIYIVMFWSLYAIPYYYIIDLFYE